MLHVDLATTLVGLLVGFVVGMTGMGGGALMTPLLVLLLGVPPLAAVGSDLAASVVIKPAGGLLHLRRGTVRLDLVLWLSLGSVPAALIGSLAVRAAGGDAAGSLLREAIGLALIASATSSLLRGRLRARRAGRPLALRRRTTVAIGALGGLLVGLTSVGSGSVIIMLLVFTYPGLSTAELVGTDLVQAVPLVAAATLGHLAFGDVRPGLTLALLVGALPGVVAGAHVSSRAPERVVRPALALVLLTTGLKLVL